MVAVLAINFNIHDFIISIPPLKDATILFGPPWDAFLPPLAGSFFGVVLGILFGVLIEYLRKDASKFKHMKMLNNEIENGIEVIKKNKGLLGTENRGLSVEINSEKVASILPTDGWNSSIYIGALRLFSFEERVKLTQKYKLIEEFNYEIKRYRDLKLNLVGKYDQIGLAARQNACTRYEEFFLPAYYNKIQNDLEELITFLKPNVIENQLKFWRYLL